MELRVDFGFSWLVLGAEGVYARSTLPQARLLLNPVAVNAALVLAPRVFSPASMDVVLWGREREAKRLDPLLFGLISFPSPLLCFFFPLSPYWILSLWGKRVWGSECGSRRSVGVTGGKAGRLGRRDACNSCAVLLALGEWLLSKPWVDNRPDKLLVWQNASSKLIINQ